MQAHTVPHDVLSRRRRRRRLDSITLTATAPPHPIHAPSRCPAAPDGASCPSKPAPSSASSRLASVNLTDGPAYSLRPSIASIDYKGQHTLLPSAPTPNAPTTCRRIQVP
ncbi:hypothetical protein MSAN_00103100 [Mycena sanguinolenta]|uniref:Uncharacterized protein n=1 Tax=Mycena sanguinolenta TaxID=230812 RepID=A0A8H7DMR2_9AGAR|nr:hypothetical protein MSAN_00103100 [Mycena sanguinolenta]